MPRSGEEIFPKAMRSIVVIEKTPEGGVKTPKSDPHRIYVRHPNSRSVSDVRPERPDLLIGEEVTTQNGKPAIVYPRRTG